MSTRDLMRVGLKHHKSGWRFGVPRCRPVEYPERELPLDPYILGAWLGDGRIGQRRARFCSFEPDDFIVDEIRRRLPASMKLVREGTAERGWYEFRPVIRRGANPVRDALDDLNVRVTSSERFIPPIYLRASVKQRWDLLKGLMDTDGSARNSRGRVAGSGSLSVHPRYYTKSRRLAEDVRSLARSLGGNAVLFDYGPDRAIAVDISVDECPFLLPRKASLWMEGQSSLAHREFPENKIISIEPTAVRESRCITVGTGGLSAGGGDADQRSTSIQVDPGDGLFLTNDYIVTHNCHQTQMKLLFLWYLPVP
jgi:intracellular multiplication protein IcmO